MIAGGKYAPLCEVLQSANEEEVVLSFADLERILKFSLPQSARLYAAWWANQTPPSSQSTAWMSVGRRAYPNFRVGKVSFRRDDQATTRSDKTVSTTRSAVSSAEDELQEDQVKEHLRAFLERAGWHTTIARGSTHGIDIEAFHEAQRWIIEVKGCGSRSPMRVNYFLGALGELLQRMNDPNAKYSVAFPDLAQFRRLWERLPRLAKERTAMSCMFVRADGEVTEVA